MTKETLLKQTDPKTLMECIAAKWPLLLNEDEQELCLEEIYDLIAMSAAEPENFMLLTNDEKAQFEIDIDMLLITIEFSDLAAVLFQSKQDIDTFWKLIGDRESLVNTNTYNALFT